MNEIEIKQNAAKRAAEKLSEADKKNGIPESQA